MLFICIQERRFETECLPFITFKYPFHCLGALDFVGTWQEKNKKNKNTKLRQSTKNF